MAKRSRSTIRRTPRTDGPHSECISIMPDGSARMFTPKQPQGKTSLIRGKNGELIIKISAL